MKLVDNKGQVLVLFVILLPVILLGVVIGVDVLNLYVSKEKTVNVIRETINYGLSNYSDDIAYQVNNMIDLNVDYDSKSVFVTESEIKIRISQSKKIFGRDFTLSYNYIGRLENDKILVSEG